jgi:hypothetical protein
MKRDCKSICKKFHENMMIFLPDLLLFHTLFVLICSVLSPSMLQMIMIHGSRLYVLLINIGCCTIFIQKMHTVEVILLILALFRLNMWSL